MDGDGGGRLVLLAFDLDPTPVPREVRPPLRLASTRVNKGGMGPNALGLTPRRKGCAATLHPRFSSIISHQASFFHSVQAPESSKVE